MQQFHFNEAYYKQSQKVLNNALDTASAYRAWRRFDPGRDKPADARYSALPLLTKQDMREHFPHGLVPGDKNVGDGLNRGEIEYVDTSGTTTEKVTNVWNQSWWNASEAASWKLNANTAHLDHTCREALLASALSVGFLSKDDLPQPARILNDRFLFLNEKVTFLEWSDFHYRRMIAELNEFKPAILEANPSLLAQLCWWAIDNDCAIYSPRVVVLTYEFPSKLHLKSIRQVFTAPVISSYGTTETGYVFMQCEHDHFHQNTDFCRVDFLPLKAIHGGPSLGIIAVTTFHNPWASIVRFDVGDLVSLHESGACACGRNDGIMLSAIEGRFVNATLSLSGRIVTTRQVDDVVSSIHGIRDYELRQSAPDRYRLTLSVKERHPQQVSACSEALRSLYGRDAAIDLDFVEKITPTASGKYRRTYADFTIDIKDYLA